MDKVISADTSDLGSRYESNVSFPQSERFAGKSKASKKQIELAVQWANENYRAIKSARVYIERVWYLNICFYYGRQYVAFKGGPNVIQGTVGNMYVPPAPYWRARPTINRIRPIIRTEISKLIAQKPTAFIIPASSDDTDLFAATAGEQIWDSIYRDKKLKATIRRAVWWNQICGTSFIKTRWDPTAIDNKSNQLGDLKYSHETPFHVFVPDFREEEIENQPFVIHVQLKSKDWVEATYPDLAYNSTSNKSEEIMSSSWLNYIGAQNVKGQHTVPVFECWIKPGAIRSFPNGALFTIIGDNVVQSVEGWPYEHGQFPFAKLGHIPSGKFYDDSTIVDLIPLQKEYNRTRGQIIENKNRMGKAQMVAEKGSVDPTKHTTEPGQWILYEQGYNKPEAITPVNLPSYVIQELDRIIADMEDVSGQHEVSNGKAPPGVTAATAISFLEEQDATKLAPTFQVLEEAIEKVAFQTLSYVRQFWDTPRAVKITGPDGAFDAIQFMGSELKNNTDVNIEAGSAMPTSKAAKQALLMDLMKFGFIDPIKGLEIMEIGGVGKLFESIQLDVRQAQRENLQLAGITGEAYDAYLMEQQNKQMESPELDPTTGQPLPVMYEGIVPTHTFDNHKIHIELHNKYRKSQAFMILDEGAKQAFEQHVREHEAAVVQDMVKDMMMQSMTGGPEEISPDNPAPPPEGV